MSVFGAVATIKAFAREINSNEERDNLPLEEVQRVLKKRKKKTRKFPGSIGESRWSVETLCWKLRVITELLGNSCSACNERAKRETTRKKSEVLFGHSYCVGSFETHCVNLTVFFFVFLFFSFKSYWRLPRHLEEDLRVKSGRLLANLNLPDAMLIDDVSSTRQDLSRFLTFAISLLRWNCWFSWLLIGYYLRGVLVNLLRNFQAVIFICISSREIYYEIIRSFFFNKGTNSKLIEIYKIFLYFNLATSFQSFSTRQHPKFEQILQKFH